MTQKKVETIKLDSKKEQKDINRYVTFTISDEHYGVPLNYIKEIIGMTEITPVPKLPHFFSGVINVRGKIISVINLCKKLSLDDGSGTKSILIVEVNGMTLGVVVGHIKEVVAFEQDQLQNDDDTKSRISNEYISSIARSDDKKLIMILNIPEILSVKELDVPQRTL